MVEGCGRGVLLPHRRTADGHYTTMITFHGPACFWSALNNLQNPTLRPTHWLSTGEPHVSPPEPRATTLASD